MSHDLPPYGSHERTLSINPHAITPSEQASSVAERDAQEAPAKARAQEIEAQIKMGGAGRAKDRGQGD